MDESEFKGVDFGCERALRAWCFDAAKDYSGGLDMNIEVAEKIYNFIKSAGNASKEARVIHAVNININLDGN